MHALIVCIVYANMYVFRNAKFAQCKSKISECAVCLVLEIGNSLKLCETDHEMKKHVEWLSH